MKLLSILSVFVILFSCTEGVPRLEEPKNLIPRDEMVSLLGELVKLEGHITQKHVRINQYHKVMTDTGDSLLTAKGYKKDQFEKSMDYYGSRQEEMLSIYDEVMNNLSEELARLESRKK